MVYRDDSKKVRKRKRKPMCADCKSTAKGLFTVGRWIGPVKGKPKTDPETGRVIPSPTPGEIKETVTLCANCRKEWSAFIR